MKKIILILIFISFLRLFSQDCPPADVGCPPFSDWVTFSYNEDMYGHEDGFSIQYKSRICNGVRDIIIDYSSLTKNGNYAFLSDITAQHMIIQRLARVLADDAARCDQGFPPAKVAFYNEKGCKVQTKCKIQVNPDQMICDTGFEGTPPISSEQIDGQTVYFYYKTHWQSCGSLCCKTVYEVCHWDNLGRGSTSIESKYNVPVDGSDCSLEGDFIDFETGQPIPCSSFCE